MHRNTRDFIVYPAIDLHDGKVVRLRQGDPCQQTLYSDNPGEVATRWLSASLYGVSSTPWLHIVNLDGAFGSRKNANKPALEAIVDVCKNFQANIQFGGGLRSLEEIEGAIQLGVNRVLLGTVIVTQPELVHAALEHFGPHKIGAALDARGGKIRIKGWTEQTEITALELGHELYTIGLRSVIYTNIDRDGTGEGVDILGAATIAEQTKLKVIASGGVNSIQDVRQAKQAGLSGIIIGRALYEGLIDLQEALQCLCQN